MIPEIRPKTPSSALKAFFVLWYYQLCSSASSSSSSSSSSSPVSSPLIKPAAAVVTTSRTSALDTSSLMDVDREMLRMFGVSMEDGNDGVNDEDSFRHEDTPAKRATGTRTEERQKPSSSLSTRASENESVTSEEGDEWWRDPFRLFESENASPKEQAQEGVLLDKSKSKGADQRGDKAKIKSAADPSPDLEQSEVVSDHYEGTLPPMDTKKSDTKPSNYLELPKASSSSALTPISREKVYVPSISSKAFTVPILIPLAALSKFKSAIPFTKYVVFVAMAQVAWSWVKDVPQVLHRWTSSNSTTSRTVMTSETDDVESMNKDTTEESSSVEGLSLEEIESLEKLGFHQYPVEPNNGKDEFQERAHVNDDGIQAGEDDTAERKRQKPSKGLFNRLVHGGQGRVSKTELKEELHKWKRRAQKAESEAESLQHEWSVCIQQLQEANAEKVRLQSTNKYLKEQLRDTQRTTEDIMKKERQKANDEIMRIREAMVEVLDRERKLIRDHMLTASKEVRAAILAAEDEKYVAH